MESVVAPITLHKSSLLTFNCLGHLSKNEERERWSQVEVIVESVATLDYSVVPSHNKILAAILEGS